MNKPIFLQNLSSLHEVNKKNYFLFILHIILNISQWLLSELFKVQEIIVLMTFLRIEPVPDWFLWALSDTAG